MLMAQTSHLHAELVPDKLANLFDLLAYLFDVGELVHDGGEVVNFLLDVQYVGAQRTEVFSCAGELRRRGIKPGVDVDPEGVELGSERGKVFP
jgi:hypothetical protein